MQTDAATPLASRRAAAERKEAAFVSFITAGYPSPADTVPLLLALEKGGTDLVELGVPFTDPQADGATIQRTNQEALKYGVTMSDCMDFTRSHRPHHPS